jgi:N-acyl-D-amino-acid deacylase
VGGCDGLLGCFRVLWFSDDDDGRRRVRGGDGWLFAVEFGDVPRAYTVLAYGQGGRPGHPHLEDQLELFVTNGSKAAAFTEADIEARTRRRYRPGVERWDSVPGDVAYDLVLRGGRVFRGEGEPWVQADVAIRDGRIVAVGDLGGVDAGEVLELHGLWVAPGFIDTHTHAAGGLARAELRDGRALLAQGITTVFVNPDGGGAVDLAAQRRDLLEHGLGVNVAQLVPHGSVRREVLGMADRAPDAAELAAMEDLVRRGMEEGAFGISTGPYYAPGSFATTEELVAVARVAATYGGVHQSHIRDEGSFSIGLDAAVEEVIRIARESGATSVITHIKALGPEAWGSSTTVVERVTRAREEGLHIFADQYPYEASATSVTGALVPRWALASGRDSLLARVAASPDRDRLLADIATNLERRGGPERIQFRRFAADPAVEGRTLAEVATERGLDPASVVLEMLTAGDAGLVSFNMHADDVERFMAQPWTMTASDGEYVALGEGVPHPRAYGTFPRKLGLYARDRGVVDVAMAIRSMTGLPAGVYGLEDRGRVAEGMAADLVVFDLERVHDPSTYTDPHHYGEGMVHVLVGGRLALRAGEFTGELAGTVLRKGGLR